MTRKILEGVSFIPTWNSFVGALGATLQALGDKRELHYIAGMSGFPFRLTINKQVCPSSPTTGWSWSDDTLAALHLLGYRGEVFFAYKTDKRYDNVKGEVRRLVESSIDEERPVIIWDTLVPEFAIIKGYDSSEKKFYVTGIKEREGQDSFPYHKLGDGEVPILYALFVLDKTDGDAKLHELDALRSFADYYAHPYHEKDEKLESVTGVEAYERWATYFDDNDINTFGNAYVAQCTAESRSWAAPFLRGVKANHPGVEGNLEEVASKFDAVSGELKQLADLFAFPGLEETINKKGNRERAAKLVRNAAKLEREAADILTDTFSG